jgi:HEPN domain-containing protein
MKREEVNRLLDRSRKFKDASEFHLSRGDYDLAVFNVEQSLQLFLKAKLLEFGVDFPRVHSLRKLFLLLGQVLDKVDVFKAFENDRSIEFASLEDAYITSRYFPRDFSKGEAERLLKFLEEVTEFVRKFSS